MAALLPNSVHTRLPLYIYLQFLSAGYATYMYIGHIGIIYNAFKRHIGIIYNLNILLKAFQLLVCHIAIMMLCPNYYQGRTELPKAARGHATRIDCKMLNVTKHRI